MNKILTAVAVVMMSAAALAEKSWWAALYTTEYGKDTSPSTTKVGDYTVYYCTKAAAEEMFGGANTLSTIENYLKANFADGKSAMGDNSGSHELLNGSYELGNYGFVSRFAEEISEGTYFGVAFYKDDAFRVFASTDVDSGNLTLESAGAGTAGNWQTKTIPEPTSGLLLLCGCALLALRRRQR